MRIITWNIQWGRGADGRVALDRTIAALRDMGGADVICLQEVVRGFPDLASDPVDEVAALVAAFPGHEAVFGAGVDVPGTYGGRGQFGNLLLSALPVGAVSRHALPFPADAGVPGMPRCCVEAVLAAPSGPLRVLTTHLEYYSALQRRTQIMALRQLQEEAAGHAGTAATSRRDANPAFVRQPRPLEAVICGDFNMEPDSPDYALMAEPTADEGVGWVDAWCEANGALAHDPTVGLHGADWPDRQYCCDYFWVSQRIAPRVRAVAVETATPASDHQPVVLELEY
ncbi:endonuclease/exonuclease/phosphatase family protein [Pseudazoarcus pumilus]|uniref:Endonuclease n=1 Tax=Pseudazoarcus pumilus TaxID=2067960 RepID=A0A2I6S6R1_9RHOO|nr:endonuclease/exonuclease/phosphatase family protein [Pseudazoarcus pumilus]AUN94957.1 endonuclease [Pseudazoarcus pumilus]